MGGALGYMQCEGVHRPPESGPDMADCGDMSGHRSYTQLSAQRPTSAGHSDDEHCCVAAESRGCFFAQVPGGHGPLVPSIPIGPRISGSSGRLGPPLGAHSLCRCDGFTPDGTDHSEGTDDNDRKDWKDMLACFASSRGGDSSASTGPARGVHRRASPSPRGLRADKGPEMTSASPRAISVQQERRSGEEADWFAACRSIPDLCAANPSDPFPLAFLPAGLVSQCDGGDLPIEHETVTERYDRRRQVTGAVCIQVHYEAETPHEDVFDLRDGEGGRLFVASLRLAGTADRMGIRVGDELVSIKVGDEPPERPDCGADSLKGIRGPVVLLFMSFAGKFPAEVRLKRPTWSGLRTTAEVFGGSSFDLCEQIVFRPEMAPLFFARKPQDESESTKETAKSNGTATTPLLYEVRRHEAKRMVHRAITEASPGSRMSMNKLSLNAPRQGGGVSTPVAGGDLPMNSARVESSRRTFHKQPEMPHAASRAGSGASGGGGSAPGGPVPKIGGSSVQSMSRPVADVPLDNGALDQPHSDSSEELGTDTISDRGDNSEKLTARRDVPRDPPAQNLPPDLPSGGWTS